MTFIPHTNKNYLNGYFINLMKELKLNSIRDLIEINEINPDLRVVNFNKKLPIQHILTEKGILAQFVND
jgi:hypothetical protein